MVSLGAVRPPSDATVLRPNFVVLSLGLHPERVCSKDNLPVQLLLVKFSLIEIRIRAFYWYQNNDFE